MSSSAYKVPVDKQALTDMMMSAEEPTAAQLKEFRKVVTIVVIKHFGKYLSHFEELYQFAVAAVFERKERFDPTFSAYSFLYTICRNEIGNKIKKYTREVVVEDILPMTNASCELEETVSVPKEIAKFRKHLTGEVDFEYVELTKLECVHVSAFLMMHQPLRCKPPEYFEDDSKIVSVLYKLHQLL